MVTPWRPGQAAGLRYGFARATASFGGGFP